MKTLCKVLTIPLFLILLSFSAKSAPPSEHNPQMTVRIRMYHSGAVAQMKPLDELGRILTEETSMGLIILTQMYREDFHQGITACFLVDPRMMTSLTHKDRILKRFAGIDPEHKFDYFQIESPSDCMQ